MPLNISFNSICKFGNFRLLTSKLIDYWLVPIETQIEFSNTNDLKLYNKNDIDITNEMKKILLQ